MTRVPTLISALIKLKGKTQTELSNEIGGNRSVLYRFLSGETDLRTETLVELLQNLGIDLEKILENEIDLTLGKSKPEISLGEALETVMQEVDPNVAKTFLTSVSSRVESKDNKSLAAALSVINEHKKNIKTLRSHA